MKKLVRDNIPEIIRASGKIPVTRILNEADYLQALKTKVAEEANELIGAPTKEAMLTELADLQELITAICLQSGYTMEELEEARQKKKSINGAFTKRIFLESIEETKVNKTI